MSEPTTEAGRWLLTKFGPDTHEVGREGILDIENEARASLGVERLAEAVRSVSPWKDDDTFLDVWRAEAVAIAAEYERLSKP